MPVMGVYRIRHMAFCENLHRRVSRPIPPLRALVVLHLGDLRSLRTEMIYLSPLSIRSSSTSAFHVDIDSVPCYFLILSSSCSSSAKHQPHPSTGIFKRHSFCNKFLSLSFSLGREKIQNCFTSIYFSFESHTIRDEPSE